MRAKKVMSLLLTMVLLTAMAVTVYADDPATGSITVNGTVSGKLYDVYRMFDLSASGQDADGNFTEFSYTLNEEWVDFFTGTGAGAQYLVEKTADNETEYEGFNILVSDGVEYFINITDSNVAGLAQAALPYAVNEECTAVQQTANNTSLVFENLELGYYLVYPEGAVDITEGNASICSITTTSPDAVTNQKATYPQINKEVDNPDSEIGEKKTYTVTGIVPDTTGFDKYIYRVTDTMTDGLTFTEDLSEFTLKINDASIEIDGTDVTLVYAENGYVLTIDMTKFQNAVGQAVKITYKAVVNDNAVAEVTENRVVLEYSNDPKDSDHTEENPPIEVPVYTSEIVIDKVDDSTPARKLKDAQFVLYQLDEGQNKLYYKYSAATDTAPASVTWGSLEDATVVITDENGAGGFAGLKDGTYYLHETVAPAGFNILTQDIEVEIVHTNTDDTAAKPIGISLTSTVSNNRGTILPITGGVGTTVFYVMGGVLAAGAAILLIVRRRMNIMK